MATRNTLLFGGITILTVQPGTVVDMRGDLILTE